MAAVINAIYHLMALFLALLIVNNFLKSKKLQESAMYIIILLPLVLRLLRFK